MPLNKTLPFESPPPEKPSALETAALIGGGTVALVVLAVAYPWVKIAAFCGWVVVKLFRLDKRPTEGERIVPAPPPELLGASAPLGDGEGNALCSRCSDVVPYASMSINEDGYFCAPCAARLTKIALDAYESPRV